MPFCHLTLSARIPPGRGYPLELKTLGDHLKKRRLDLGLHQRDAAKQVGVSTATFYNWERGRSEPEFRFLPAIICFLGYDPTPEPASLAERIQATRHRQGISQRELACRLGLDPSTVTAWERGEVAKPYPRFLRLFEEYVRGGGT